jgi:hypothetical protein
MRIVGIVPLQRSAHNNAMTGRARLRGLGLAAGAVLAWTTACAGGQTGHTDSLDCGEHAIRELSFDEAAQEGYDVRPLFQEGDGGRHWREEELELEAPMALWTARSLDVPDDRVVIVTLRTRPQGSVRLTTSDCSTQGGLPTDAELEIAAVGAVLPGFGHIATHENGGTVVVDVEVVTLDELRECAVTKDRSRLLCAND